MAFAESHGCGIVSESAYEAGVSWAVQFVNIFHSIYEDDTDKCSACTPQKQQLFSFHLFDHITTPSLPIYLPTTFNNSTPIFLNHSKLTSLRRFSSEVDIFIFIIITIVTYTYLPSTPRLDNSFERFSLSCVLSVLYHTHSSFSILQPALASASSSSSL